jgi:hypothetical protein
MLINSYIHMDPDAVAFLNAQGNTNTKEKYALNRLVVDLKQAGIWTKCEAIYPFLGSTAAFHKWNLKDPRDLDAAFRLVFFGGWTHSSNGALPNGTNAYADTKLQPSLNLSSVNNIHFSIYSRTNTAGGSKGNGIYQISNTQGLYLTEKNSTNNFNGVIGDDTQGILTSNLDSRGFYTVNRSASNNIKGFVNGNLAVTNTNASTGLLSTINVYLSAINTVGFGIVFYNDKQLAFSSIGESLTDTEALNYYNSVQRFQTTLGRQV